MVFVTNVSDNGLYIKDGVNGFVVEPDDMKMMYDLYTPKFQRYWAKYCSKGIENIGREI